MIPTAMFWVVLLVCVGWAVIVGWAIGRRVERKRHNKRINVFDAYTDDLLAREREDTAAQVRKYHGSPYHKATFDSWCVYLAQIDKEIARRRVLEESNVSQTMRELAAFDTVFAAIESSPKENK